MRVLRHARLMMALAQGFPVADHRPFCAHGPAPVVTPFYHPARAGRCCLPDASLRYRGVAASGYVMRRLAPTLAYATCRRAVPVVVAVHSTSLHQGWRQVQERTVVGMQAMCRHRHRQATMVLWSLPVGVLPSWAAAQDRGREHPGRVPSDRERRLYRIRRALSYRTMHRVLLAGVPQVKARRARL